VPLAVWDVMTDGASSHEWDFGWPGFPGTWAAAIQSVRAAVIRYGERAMS
jgi:hypothetical protein